MRMKNWGDYFIIVAIIAIVIFKDFAIKRYDKLRDIERERSYQCLKALTWLDKVTMGIDSIDIQSNNCDSILNNLYVLEDRLYKSLTVL